MLYSKITVKQKLYGDFFAHRNAYIMLISKLSGSCLKGNTLNFSAYSLWHFIGKFNVLNPLI